MGREKEEDMYAREHSDRRGSAQEVGGGAAGRETAKVKTKLWEEIGGNNLTLAELGGYRED